MEIGLGLGHERDGRQVGPDGRGLGGDHGQHRVALGDRRIHGVGRAVDHRRERSARLRAECVDVGREVTEVRLHGIESRGDRGIVRVDEAGHDRAVRAWLHRGHETRGSEGDDDRGHDPDDGRRRGLGGRDGGFEPGGRTRLRVRRERVRACHAGAIPSPVASAPPVSGPANTSPRVRWSRGFARR